jgi:hypothetical protein
MFGDERGEDGRAGLVGAGRPDRAPAVILQGKDDLVAREPHAPVPGSEHGLVFPGHRVPVHYQVAGAGAVEQANRGRSLRVPEKKGALLDGWQEVGAHPGREHRADFT